MAQATTAIEQRAGNYCDRPEDMPLIAVVHAAFNVLESKLAQVEKELSVTKQHRDDLIEELRREQQVDNKAPMTRLGIK